MGYPTGIGVPPALATLAELHDLPAVIADWQALDARISWPKNVGEAVHISARMPTETARVNQSVAVSASQ